jgi:excisionase family DNA binding protein
VNDRTTTDASNALALELDRFPGLFVSPEDLAGVLGLSVRHIYAQIEKGSLPAVKSGRFLRIHKHDIHVYCRT